MAHSPSEHYTGKVTPVGNSKGIRLDARFFKAHPELIEPVDRAQLKRIGKLVAGVKTD